MSGAVSCSRLDIAGPSVPELGEHDREGRAAAGGGVQVHAPAVPLRDRLHDRQAEAGAAAGGAVHAGEALEDALLVLGGDADALVLHAHADLRPVEPRDAV